MLSECSCVLISYPRLLFTQDDGVLHQVLVQNLARFRDLRPGNGLGRPDHRAVLVSKYRADDRVVIGAVEIVIIPQDAFDLDQPRAACLDGWLIEYSTYELDPVGLLTIEEH